MTPYIPQRSHLFAAAILFTSTMVFFFCSLFSSSDLCRRLPVEDPSFEDKWFSRPSEFKQSATRIVFVCSGLVIIALLPLLCYFRTTRYHLPRDLSIFPDQPACQELKNIFIYFTLSVVFYILHYLHRLSPGDFILDQTHEYVSIDGVIITECFIGHGYFIWFNDVLFLYACVFTGMVILLSLDIEKEQNILNLGHVHRDHAQFRC